MRWRLSLAWAASSLLVIGLAWMCWKKGLEDAANAASVLGAVGMVGVLLAWARQRRLGHGHSTSAQLTDAAEALARSVRRQWKKEARLRQLFDPMPMPVIWADSSLPHVSDHRQLIGAPVTCRADEPGGLVTALRGLSRQRLVVIGEAGAGKTTFAVLLTLALLREPSAESPVPVLLSLSSFDPSRESAQAWLCRRIAADYPVLNDVASYGPSAIEDLLSEHRIIPILDGLDERPAPTHTAVLIALNETLDSHAPFVLTCRTTSFTNAVTEGEILIGTAVIEPAPLRTTDAINLLRLATPPGHRQQQWDVVAEHLSQHPHGPPSRVLANPLMVALTRAAYADSPGDPSQLIDSRRFPDAASIEQHLLETLIPTVYARAQQQEPGRYRWKQERVQEYLTQIAVILRREGTHDFSWWQIYRTAPALASTWGRTILWTIICILLTLLVGQIYQSLSEYASFGFSALVIAPFAYLLCQIPPLAGIIAIGDWLRRRARPARHPYMTAIITALCGSTFGFLTAAAFNEIAFRMHMGFTLADPLEYPRFYILRGISPGFFYPDGLGITVLFYGIALFITATPALPLTPSRTNPSLRQWRHRWPSALSIVCVSGIVAYIISYARASGIRDHATSASIETEGLIYGPVIGVAIALLQWVKSPGSRNDLTTPESSVRSDRLFFIVTGFFVAIIPTLMIRIPDVSVDLAYEGLSYWYPEKQAILDIGRHILVTWVLSLTVALSSSAWAHYTVARLYLSLRGKLPFRLQAFLAHAHRVGILRQVGPIYQFRHARLRDHLSSESTQFSDSQCRARAPLVR